MNCKGVQASLSAYLDRELSGEEMIDVRAHLVRCPECQDEEQSLRSLKRLLCGLEAPDPAPDFQARLLARVHKGSRGSVRERLRPSVSLFAGVAAGAMAITLALLTINGRAPVPSPAKPNIAFEAQRYHEVYTAGTDAYGGAPILSTSYGAR